MIAGGIGITPFLSIIRDMADNSNSFTEPTKLLYIDSNNEFIYKDEFNKISDENNFIIEYINQREELTKSIEIFISKNKNNASYFIVGSPKMTKSIITFLKNNHIKRKNIIKDNFIGY